MISGKKSIARLMMTRYSVVLNVIPLSPRYALTATVFDDQSIDSNVPAINIGKRIMAPLGAAASRTI